MMNFFDKKENKKLINITELDKCSCKECEGNLKLRFNSKKEIDLWKKEDIEFKNKKVYKNSISRL